MKKAAVIFVALLLIVGIILFIVARKKATDQAMQDSASTDTPMEDENGIPINTGTNLGKKITIS